MPSFWDNNPPSYKLAIKKAVIGKNYGLVSGLLSDFPALHKENFFKEEGVTLLHFLAFQSSECLTTESAVYKIATLLIDHGAKPNFQDEQGETPLHVAARRGNALLAKLLMERGADNNTTDKDGRKPADLAIDEPLQNTIKENSNWGSAIEAQQKRECNEPVTLHVPKGMHI